MGSRVDSALAAFVVPVVDIHDYETANDGTTNNSSYTESTPRPGIAVADSELSTLVPVITGAQDDDLVLRVAQGGAPGLGTSSLQLAYKYAADTAYRGWTACNGFVDWDAVYWTTTSTSDHFDAVVHPHDQRVLVAYGDTGGSSIRFSRWSPTTATWSALSSLTGTPTAVAMCALPSGRVLLYGYGGDFWRSDNFGTSWTRHGTTTLSLERARMAVVDGEILLIGLEPGTETLRQYASSDGGATFTLVETIADFGTKLSACALPDGRIVIVYREYTTGDVQSKTIGSPWDPISEATEVVIDDAAHTDVCATADPDGLLWAYGTNTAGLAGMWVWCSTDGGATWTEFDVGAVTISTSNADSLRPMKAVSTQGQVMVLSKFVASTGTNDPSIVSLRFGGWNSAPLDTTAATSGFFARVGYGPSLATFPPFIMLPIERPDNAGWTAVGTATNATLSSGRVNITTSGAQCAFRWIPGTDLSMIVQAGLRVVSGGGLATRVIALTTVVGNASNEYRVDVRFTTTGFRVHDPHASGGSGSDLETVTYDTTTEFDILVEINNAAAQVLYKRPYESVWATAWSGNLTNLGSGSTGLLDWGHITTGTGQSEWRYVGLIPQGRTGTLGRPISSLPIPLHSEVSDGVTVGRLSAIGGSGALAETFTVRAEHDYPGDAIYPQVSPSPAAKWRTTSKGEQIRAWFLDETALLGDEVHQAIIAIGCNFRLAYLEEDNGGWTTVATLDLAQGFTNLNYIRTGSVLVAGNGGTAPARFVGKNELRGGYAVIETGSGTGTIAKRIVGNTPGWWTASTSTQQLRVILEGVGGTEDASGQCDLVWPSGVAFNLESSVRYRRRWRIRIPSAQVTPDDYYEAGILVPAALHVPGAPPDWGYSYESKPNVVVRKTPYGTRFVRELGPPVRTLSFGWAAGGVDLTRLYASPTDGDYLGVAGHLPLAAAEDVPAFMDGLQVYVKSGAVPVVWLKYLPSSDTTITDPRLWLYGHITSSVGYDHELGNDDEGGVVRPIAVTIEEVR